MGEVLGAHEEGPLSARYQKEIFGNYFETTDSEYLRVHRGNQESYEDNFADLLPADKTAKILEIGCGAGQLLWYLKSKGYENILGVDVGQTQIDLVKRLGIDGRVISSIPEFLSDKRGTYDLIVMNAVIEHFTKQELWDNLRAIHGALKGGGSVVFSTPNMACLSSGFQRYIDFTHETGFTERSAYEVMRITGFKEIVLRPDRIKLKPRPRRVVWWAFNKLWYALLKFLYYIERGDDRPKIVSRLLIVTGKK